MINEKRLTERLKKYWDQMRGDEQLPTFARLNPDRVRDLWPNCMTLQVVEVQSNNRLYAYEYIGSALQAMYGKDMTGRTTSSNFHDVPGWEMLKKMDAVIIDPHVVSEEGQFINSKGKIIKFRACLLPFGSEKRVSHVLVGMSYKEF